MGSNPTSDNLFEHFDISTLLLGCAFIAGTMIFSIAQVSTLTRFLALFLIYRGQNGNEGTLTHTYTTETKSILERVWKLYF